MSSLSDDGENDWLSSTLPKPAAVAEKSLTCGTSKSEADAKIEESARPLNLYIGGCDASGDREVGE